MNAPLPEHILKALQTVSLDDKLQISLSRRHKSRAGAAGSGLGVELVAQGGSQ